MAQSSTGPAAGESNETSVTVISLNAYDGAHFTLAYRARFAPSPAQVSPPLRLFLAPAAVRSLSPLTQIMPSLAPSDLCRRPVARRTARS